LITLSIASFSQQNIKAKDLTVTRNFIYKGDTITAITPLTLTTVGTSGAATLVDNVLNIPIYSLSGGTGLWTEVPGAGGGISYPYDAYTRAYDAGIISTKDYIYVDNIHIWDVRHGLKSGIVAQDVFWNSYDGTFNVKAIKKIDPTFYGYDIDSINATLTANSTVRTVVIDTTFVLTKNWALPVSGVKIVKVGNGLITGSYTITGDETTIDVGDE